MTDSDQTEWLTVSQLANRFNVSTASIWRWVRDDKFPAPIRVSNRCTRWRRADIEQHENKLAEAAA